MRTSLITPLVYLGITLAWSGGWIAGKLGVSAVPPLELSAIRFLVAGCLMVAAARLAGARLRTDRLGLVLLATVFGVLGYNAFVFTGLTMSPASDAALIVPTVSPVLTAVAATAIGERLTARKVIGLVLSAFGALLVVAAGPGISGGLSSERLTGDLLHLAGAACFSAYATIGSVAMRSGSPLGFVAVSTLVGGVLLFPLGFLENGYRDVPGWPLHSWLALGYLILGATIVGFLLFFWAVRRYGAGVSAMTTYLVPVATLLLAFVVLGERPEPLQLVGGAVILLGVHVATRRRGASTEDAATPAEIAARSP